MSKDKERVVLGLSGGVDSSVSAKLLKDKGYDLIGLFMRNWDSLLNNDILGNPNDIEDVCPQEKDYMDALKVGETLGIKVERVDFVEEYWRDVFSYFLKEYEKGRTPNPDVMCNKYIKFDVFKKEALKLGADKIAMGHFARIKFDKDGTAHLFKAKDLNKDQTYFLSLLKNEQLRNCIFPIGELTKKEIRDIAKEANLHVYSKKDSTGICFIGERKFSEFLKNYLPAKKGNIVSKDGILLGVHYGLMNYTIGQRKGLGIGGIKGTDNEPWFVCGKDLKTNTLEVSQNEEDLLSDMCIIEDINLINPLKSNDIKGKFRYRAKDENIHVELKDNNEAIITYTNVKSVTPGQILVFYDQDECLGGGIIKEVYYKGNKRNY